jgi:hypothetical protein
MSVGPITGAAQLIAWLRWCLAGSPHYKGIFPLKLES